VELARLEPERALLLGSVSLRRHGSLVSLGLVRLSVIEVPAESGG
jgi:hypothetical protein